MKKNIDFCGEDDNSGMVSSVIGIGLIVFLSSSFLICSKCKSFSFSILIFIYYFFDLNNNIHFQIQED